MLVLHAKNIVTQNKNKAICQSYWLLSKLLLVMLSTVGSPVTSAA